MRLAEHCTLLALIVLGGCTKSEPPRREATPSTQATSPQSAADDQRLVRISRFDCVKAEDAAGSPVFPWDRGISLWKAGGPGGATSNASMLHCALEFQINCTRGEADAEIRISGALSKSQRLKIDRAGAQLIDFELEQQQWEQHFDQGSALTERFPYQTATFSAAITAACEAPEALGPSLGPRREFADDRHFTAGFSNAE
jgi:hypothetical protein